MNTSTMTTRQPAETYIAGVGYVCAEPDPGDVTRMCGQPTADNPCPTHGADR